METNKEKLLQELKDAKFDPEIIISDDEILKKSIEVKKELAEIKKKKEKIDLEFSNQPLNI
ncbi:MAG: hypothetical protein US50_C0013G0005 [Candidatus Nomurabacteria bacterium GW2011_GWB1_37_5]|uniref:Uncharacterized protein n=1 Tax=Candidatus Nomurabacteria bacterium GW2011_GWB1_37_5 TaxID=1618742 RepID=A0A0G0K4C3_9BACT|nr:MAG: hypothetical protein US50_C0013G0005 [Candidatus Nomurabacteria bacterium GW2011_GWB1_37_5]